MATINNRFKGIFQFDRTVELHLSVGDWNSINIRDTCWFII